MTLAIEATGPIRWIERLLGRLAKQGWALMNFQDIYSPYISKCFFANARPDPLGIFRVAPQDVVQASQCRPRVPKA